MDSIVGTVLSRAFMPPPSAQTRSSDVDLEENHEGDLNRRGADPHVLRFCRS